MRPVYTAKILPDGELACSLLVEYGIEAYVVGGEMLGIKGASLPVVWDVHDEDEARAIALIRQHRERPPGPGEDWSCPKCEEENEGGFPTCWNCGAAKGI